ncbi:hypothetical protein Lal_00009337 [Lupinus albus]|nr:hypothetical protein Lal_00009337 [Lupinus albus]
MEMSNLTSKLKSHMLKLDDDLCVHLVLISLPAYFRQFKVSYNTQNDKWSLNQLISHCGQEDERLQRDKTESSHLVMTPQNNNKKNNKGAVSEFFQQKKLKSGDKFTCYFYKKQGHIKKECHKYVTLRVKKDLMLSLKRGISRLGEAALAQARILHSRQVLNATFLAQERQLSLRRDHSRSSEAILAQVRILQYNPGFHPPR